MARIDLAAVLEKRGDGWVITHFHWSSRKVK
jgi:hypothetical protein